MRIIIGISVLIVFVFIRRLSLKETKIDYSNVLVVVDAGHGGDDPGTIGTTGVYEKDINLEIATRLNKKLKSKGYDVIFIRDEDVYVENKLRTEIANEKGADYFISIHCNAMENKNSINGLQVLYYPSMDNGHLAQLMMDELLEETKANDKGVIPREDLMVLSKTKMPAMIIECGFLSNEEEEKKLLSDSYKDKIVDGIVNGLNSILSER